MAVIRGAAPVQGRARRPSGSLLQYALEDVFATADVGPSFERITRSAHAIRSGRVGMRVTLDDRLTLEAGYQHVYLYGAAFASHRLEPQEVLALPASVQWFSRRLTFEEKMAAEVPSDLRVLGLNEAWFDLDRLAFALTIPSRSPGRPHADIRWAPA